MRTDNNVLFFFDINLYCVVRGHNIWTTYFKQHVQKHVKPIIVIPHFSSAHYAQYASASQKVYTICPRKVKKCIYKRPKTQMFLMKYPVIAFERHTLSCVVMYNHLISWLYHSQHVTGQGSLIKLNMNKQISLPICRDWTTSSLFSHTKYDSLWINSARFCLRRVIFLIDKKISISK